MGLAPKVTLTLGNGESKQHSVRFKVLSTDSDEVQKVLRKHGLPDMYIPRSILYDLGVQDYEGLVITIERHVPKP